MDLHWHWMYVAVPIGLAALGSCVWVPLFRSAKRLNDRMTDQVTRSVALVKECAGTLDCETGFGRPPASR